MGEMGLQGVIRGKPVRTTVSDKAAPCPMDHVNRQFHAPAPNRLWLSDFTYVATWAGFVYVAFVIDAYARRIVGWRASRTAHASFVLDALEQALHERRPWSSPPSSGSTGSTTAACSRPSATFHRPRLRPPTTPSLRPCRSPRKDPNNSASGKPRGGSRC